MHNIQNHNFFNSHALLIARVLMGGLFLLAGINKLANLAGTTAYIDSVGLPAAGLLALAAGIFETALGAALILGFHFAHAALLLAIFTFIVTFIFHHPGLWDTTDPTNPQQLFFLKNLAIVAGLLFMVAHGTGNSWVLGSKRHNVGAAGETGM